MLSKNITEIIIMEKTHSKRQAWNKITLSQIFLEIANYLKNDKKKDNISR